MEPNLKCCNSISLIIAVCILLLGCGDAEENGPVTVYNGLVLDYFDSSAVEGVIVNVDRGEGFSNITRSIEGIETVSATSNSKGKYSVKVEEESKIVYKLSAEKQGYVKAENPFVIGRLIKANEVNSDTIYVGLGASLKIKISKSTSTIDTLGLSIGDPDARGIDVLSFFKLYYFELESDTVLNPGFLIDENRPARISWNILSNGREVQDSTQVVLVRGVTKDIDISY